MGINGKKHKRSTLNRRLFLKKTSVASAVTLAFTNACGLRRNKSKDLDTVLSITNYERQTYLAVFEHLLPSSLPESPGANDVNTLNFMLKTLKSGYFDNYDRRFALKGIKWVQDTAIEMYDTYFHKLNLAQKEMVLRDLETYSNGENWLSRMLTFIMEALLSDPVYGGNVNQAGWDWLQHQPGYPRPTPEKTVQNL